MSKLCGPVEFALNWWWSCCAENCPYCSPVSLPDTLLITTMYQSALHEWRWVYLSSEDVMLCCCISLKLTSQGEGKKGGKKVGVMTATSHTHTHTHTHMHIIGWEGRQLKVVPCWEEDGNRCLFFTDCVTRSFNTNWQSIKFYHSNQVNRVNRRNCDCDCFYTFTQPNSPSFYISSSSFMWEVIFYTLQFFFFFT